MAKIAYQKTGIRSEEPEFLWKIGFVARAASYKLKRLLKMRTRGALSIPDKLNFIDFDDWIRKRPAFRDYVKKILLSDETAKAGYFNRDYLEKIIDDHMNYRKHYSRHICALITFEL